MAIVPPAGYDTFLKRLWKVPQGSDTVNPFRFGYRLEPEGDLIYPDFDTEDWSASSQMRKAVGKTPVWAEFLSSATDGARIALWGLGYASIILPGSVTSDPSWNGREDGFYDCEFVSPTGARYRPISGPVKVYPDITRLGQ